MTTQELSLVTPPVIPTAAVEGSRSTSCWTVEERAWKQDLPDLPDEVIALLAAPVVVSASAWLAARDDVLLPAPGRPEPAEDETDRYPSPHDPCCAVPHFLAPAF